jgi:hypothetical protein
MVPSNPEDFKQAKKNTALSITTKGHAVNIQKYGTTELCAAIKQDVHHFTFYNKRSKQYVHLNKIF